MQPMDAITLTIPHLNAEGFLELCQANQDLQLELAATGEVIVMPPTFPSTGKQNSGLNAQLWNWNDRTDLGIVFDSSTGFTLPNGAVRSPDASWVSNHTKLRSKVVDLQELRAIERSELQQSGFQWRDAERTLSEKSE
ncbi:MAG: Uma2 family endonuclease [Aphanothece sp. CMT-3BRIN-NPC111]|jgi:Uma2 family endonuclease|nr:Uma2 family endonuclease [Aphanothece sp. CMT-3BRIN-NPC111]